MALPPPSLRFTNRANYIAKLGSARSGALKFSRRMYTTSITTAGRAITFSGNVTRPFAKQLEPVTIRVAASCTAIAAGTVVATVSLTQDDGLPAFAERFAGAGITVLTFDFRHLGESGGEPRQVIDTDRQHEGFRAFQLYPGHAPQVRVVPRMTSCRAGR